MGLHIGMLRSKELLHPVDGNGLNNVHVLTATVVALAGVALCVLVAQHRGRGIHDRLRCVVLRGDEHQRVLLAIDLVFDGLGDLRVFVLQYLRGIQTCRRH